MNGMSNLLLEKENEKGKINKNKNYKMNGETMFFIV